MRHDSRFDNQFDRELASFDRQSNKVFGAALAAWSVGALVSLALAGVVIWAIIQLVLHFT